MQQNLSHAREETDAISIVRAALTAQYGVPVLRSDANTFQSWVLPGKPLQLARQALQDAGLSTDFAVSLDVETLTWFAIPTLGLDLWRNHGETDERVTYLEAGDPPVQSIAEHEGWTLVRAADGATGWMQSDQELGNEVDRFEPREIIAGDFNTAAFVAEVSGLMDVPYVWGGTSRDGVDCSGLVQRAAWNSNNIWLPRHSTALLRVGVRVARKELAVGDVLVLRRKPDSYSELEPGEKRHPMHVAVVVDDDSVIHASRDAWKVVEEPATELLERYSLLSARRFGASA